MVVWLECLPADVTATGTRVGLHGDHQARALRGRCVAVPVRTTAALRVAGDQSLGLSRLTLAGWHSSTREVSNCDQILILQNIASKFLSVSLINLLICCHSMTKIENVTVRFSVNHQCTLFRSLTNSDVIDYKISFKKESNLVEPHNETKKWILRENKHRKS